MAAGRRQGWKPRDEREAWGCLDLGGNSGDERTGQVLDALKVAPTGSWMD